MESESDLDSGSDCDEELYEMDKGEDQQLEDDDKEYDEKKNKRNPTSDVFSDNWKHISGDKYLNVGRNETLPSPKIPIDSSLEDPYNLFCLFFPDELFNLIAVETNRYYHQFIEENKHKFTKNQILKQNKWNDLTVETAKSFVAIIFLMGINPRHSLRDHWQSNPLLRSVASDHISSGKFLQIWRFLHLHDNR